MPKYVTIEWDEYQELIKHSSSEETQPKQSVIQGYVEGAIMMALFHKFVPDGHSVTLSEDDFPMRRPEELVKIDQLDGTIKLFARPKFTV